MILLGASNTSKLPQKSKRKQQKIAADILESIDDYIYSLDKKWNFSYINKTAAKDFGFPPNELVGKNIWNMFPKLVGTAVEKNYFEAMDKREIKRFEWKTVYVKNKVKEFTVFPSAEGVTVYSKDITERKKAEEELYKSRELLKNIINSADSVIIARDLDEKLILLNNTESTLYGMPVEKALGTTPYDIYPKKVAEDIMIWDKKVFSEGKSFRYEENVPVKGELRTYVTNKFPLKNSDGKVYGLGAVITDITERKQIEIKLEQYSKNLEKIVEERTRQLQEKERLATIGETAGMVGHDLRNPLQSIAGDLYLLDCDISSLPESNDKKSMQESVSNIQENLLYIDKIVEDLKNYAKQITPNLEMVNVEKVIEEAMLIVPIPSNLQVALVVENGFPMITADFSMLKRVLTNLLQNAVQAMPQGGKLSVDAKCRDTDVFISVEDTGVGISEELKPKLFQPMVTTKAKGQGLGLAVVKRLVEAQGGAVSFESEEGKGTKFTVKLKVKPEGFKQRLSNQQLT
jgi:PAS domain S-box-containing protein